MKNLLRKTLAWALALLILGSISQLSHLSSPNTSWLGFFGHSGDGTPVFYLLEDIDEKMAIIAIGLSFASFAILYYGHRAGWNDLKLMAICMLPFYGLSPSLWLGIVLTGGDISWLGIIIGGLLIGGPIGYLLDFISGLGILKILNSAKLP